MKHLVLAMVMATSVSVSAKVRVDDNRGDKTFKVEGKTVTAAQANVAGAQGKVVEVCKQKDVKGDKAFYGENGQSLGKVVECTKMDLVINPKTGGTSFKKQK